MHDPNLGTDLDRHWMAQALELAGRSVGLSSPNPAVGCILVQSNDVVVGQGFHEYDLLDHAEIVALKQAAEDAHGATAYVTLEPCSHRGRTGPCADALIAAGISRVVVATGDPNPSVNGQGIERLRAAGIPVTTGVLQAQARDLNDAFAAYIQTGRPFVTLKVGISLDGGIAPREQTPGKLFYITSEASRAAVHEMRRSADALITGIGTVLADDPLLTDRSGLPRRRPLMRVVLDSHLRIPLDSQLVRSAKDDVMVFCCEAHPERSQALEAAGVFVEKVDGEDGHVSLPQVLKSLGERRMLGVLLEGGSHVNASALKQQIVDKLCLFFAPVILGAGSVPLFAGVPRIVPAGTRITWKTIGDDVCFESYLRDPWSE